MAKNENIFEKSQTLISEMNSLWVEKYRPTNLNELAANKILLAFIKSCIDEQDIPNILLHGKPGSGKNSIVSILKNNIDAAYLVINASEERGIDTIREKVMYFALSAGWDDKLKIVVMNEADGLNSIAQDSLRELIENASQKCRFIFTCNYVSKIIDPIRSRCTDFELVPTPKEIAKRLYQIYTLENISFENDFIPMLIKKYGVDIRKMINESQKIYKICGELRTDIIDSSVNRQYYDFFDIIINELSAKKIAAATKKMIFSDDIYTIFKDYMIEKFDSAEAIPIIGDWCWRARNMADRDLAFMSCLFQIQTLIGVR